MVSFKSRVIAICAAGTLAIGSVAASAPATFAQEAADADNTVVDGETTDGAEGNAVEGAVDRPFGESSGAGAPNGLLSGWQSVWCSSAT